MTDENALALRELIETIGEHKLELRLVKYSEPIPRIVRTMGNLPKGFRVSVGEHGGTKWQDAVAHKIFGLASVEVTMFYPKGKGGEKN